MVIPDTSQDFLWTGDFRIIPYNWCTYVHTYIDPSCINTDGVVYILTAWDAHTVLASTFGNPTHIVTRRSSHPSRPPCYLEVPNLQYRFMMLYMRTYVCRYSMNIVLHVVRKCTIHIRITNLLHISMYVCNSVSFVKEYFILLKSILRGVVWSDDIHSISSQQDKFYPLYHFHSIIILQTGESVKFQIINDLTMSQDTVKPPNWDQLYGISHVVWIVRWSGFWQYSTGWHRATSLLWSNSSKGSGLGTRLHTAGGTQWPTSLCSGTSYSDCAPPPQTTPLRWEFPAKINTVHCHNIGVHMYMCALICMYMCLYMYPDW